VGWRSATICWRRSKLARMSRISVAVWSVIHRPGSPRGCPRRPGPCGRPGSPRWPRVAGTRRPRPQASVYLRVPSQLWTANELSRVRRRGSSSARASLREPSRETHSLGRPVTAGSRHSTIGPTSLRSASPATNTIDLSRSHLRHIRCHPKPDSRTRDALRPYLSTLRPPPTIKHPLPHLPRPQIRIKPPTTQPQRMAEDPPSSPTPRRRAMRHMRRHRTVERASRHTRPRRRHRRPIQPHHLVLPLPRPSRETPGDLTMLTLIANSVFATTTLTAGGRARPSLRRPPCRPPGTGNDPRQRLPRLRPAAKRPETHAARGADHAGANGLP
jgi:hypothetical protein